MTDENESSPLPTTNQAASLADKTVQDILQDLEAPIEAAAIAAQPILGDPFIKQAWETFFQWLMGIAKNTGGTLAGYVVIDVEKYKALTNASQALVALRAAQTSGDPDALSQANQNVDAAIAPILHYVGSVSSQ